ncbi:hypothetical protein ACMA1I_05675 [Pontibacter sp. 13R65]|uniref:hypothetical protein n=1 Tax=Pontibacter sp. 13R65 TaxID=3127458 RepID=UPI00301BC1FC
MSKPASTSLGLRLLKIAGILFGSLLSLLLIVSLLLLTLLEPYVERFVKKQVTENTEGLYNLDFEKLQLNLLNGSFTLYNLHVLPDTTVHQQQKERGQASNMLLEVQAPLLEIKGIRLLNVLLRKQLRIGEVLLDKPQITGFYDGSIAGETSEEEVTQAPEFIEAVRIGKIHIPGATYRQVQLASPEQAEHLVQQIVFQMKDLRLNLRAQPDHSEMFDAADIRLQIKDYTYQSPDSVYSVSMGGLDYSSAKGEFLLRHTQIRSNNQANLALHPSKASPTVFDLYVPELRISGLNVLEAYQSKQLRVEQLHLERADLAILQNPTLPASPDTPDLAELYKQISPYLSLLLLQELHILNAQLALRQQLEVVQTVQQLNGITVAIQGVQVDSSTLFSPKENFFVEALHFAAQNYCFQYPESPYLVQAEKLELDTRNKTLKAANIEIAADLRKNDRLKKAGKASPTLYNLSLPQLQVKSLDLIQAYQTGTLAIGSIRLEKPAIGLINDPQVEAQDFEKALRETYQQVSRYVQELKLKELSIQDATFSHQTKDGKLWNSQKLQHAAVVATGITIDSVFVYNPTKALPINDLVVSARDYTFHLPGNPHQITLGTFSYSTRRQELTAQTLEVHADTTFNNQLKPSAKALRRLFDVSATQLKITGLDVVRAFNSRQLHLNELILSQPEVAILQDNEVPESPDLPDQQEISGQLFGLLNTISIKVMRLDDGNFTYHDRRNNVVRTQRLVHASATVSGFHLTADKLNNLDESLPVEELTLTASDYSYRSPDSLYTLQLGKLQYSSREQELLASSIDLVSDKEVHKRLKKEHKEEASRNLFDLSAEHFKITGLDLVRAYETGKFTMGEIKLTQPEVGILQDQNVPATDQEAENTDRLNDMVESFRVKNINITDGTFRLNMLQDTLLRSQTIKHVSLALEQFRLVDLQASDPLDMFYVDDMGLLIRDYAIYLPDSLYQLQVKEVRTNLNEQAVYIDSVRLVPLYELDEFTKKLDYADDRFDITVPAISLHGINLNALYNYQDIVVEKVLVQDLEATLYRDNRLPQDPNRKPFTLQKMLRGLDLYLAVDTVLVERSKLSYAEIAPNGINPGQLILNDMRLEGFHITNDASLIEKNDKAIVHGSTQFMDESKLKVLFEFYLNHPEDMYTYQGTLEPMKFGAINPLLENLMAVRAKEGKIKQAIFSVTSTEHEAVGHLDFLYEDLKIKLLNKEDKEKTGFLLNAGSWLINNLVLKSNNPAGRRELRPGTIEVSRNYQKSVFNHMSKAMIDGITSSLMPPLVEKVVNIFISE